MVIVEGLAGETEQHCEEFAFSAVTESPFDKVTDQGAKYPRFGHGVTCLNTSSPRLVVEETNRVVNKVVVSVLVWVTVVTVPW